MLGTVPFSGLLTLPTHSLAPNCLLRSFALLAHSFTPELMGKWMIRCLKMTWFCPTGRWRGVVWRKWQVFLAEFLLFLSFSLNPAKIVKWWMMTKRRQETKEARKRKEERDKEEKEKESTAEKEKEMDTFALGERKKGIFSAAKKEGKNEVIVRKEIMKRCWKPLLNFSRVIAHSEGEREKELARSTPQ